MRLLHVVDSLERGGLERVVTDLAIAQRLNGHHVTVYSLQSTDGLKAELQVAGIDVVIGGKSGTLDLNAMRVLRDAARERCISVAHAHSYVPNYYAAASLLGLARGPVLVGTCHDMGTRLSNRKLRWLYRSSLLRTATVAMVGRQVHDRFVGGGLVAAHKARTVLNGIPVERFEPSALRRTAARRSLALPDDAIVLGAVGRLVALKNHHLLIEILPTLIARWPALRLVIIGGGPLEAELAAQVAREGLGNHVLLPGQRSDVADLMQAFDIFVMPSLTEGLSIALLEACATALPIVATRVGGNAEIVRDGESGLLVAPGNGLELRIALDKLMSDLEQRARLGSAARAWVKAYASIEAVCRGYERLYTDALASARRYARDD